MVHLILFHLKSPKKIVFLTCTFSLWCWPELKASRRSVCSHFVSFVIPGDAVGTQTFQDLQSTHLGKQKQDAKVI